MKWTTGRLIAQEVIIMGFVIAVLGCIGMLLDKSGSATAIMVGGGLVGGGIGGKTIAKKYERGENEK